MQNIMLKTQNLLIAKLEILLFSFFWVIPILIRRNDHVTKSSPLQERMDKPPNNIENPKPHNCMFSGLVMTLTYVL